MLVTTIVALVLLLTLSLVVGRSASFPPAIFSGTWLLTLLALLLSGSRFRPVHPGALLVFLGGAVAFAAGGFLVQVVLPVEVPPARPPPPALVIGRMIDLALLVLVIGLPLYWRDLVSGLDDPGGPALLHAIRASQVEKSEGVGSLGLVTNLVVVAQIVAAVAFDEWLRGRLGPARTALVVVLALVYGALSGTKGNAVVLVLTLFFLRSLRRGRIRLVDAAVAGSAVAVTFMLIAAFVNLAGADLPFGEFAESLFSTVEHYWVGGVVAFGSLVENPGSVQATQPVHRFLLDTGRSLGFDVQLPPRHAVFTSIGGTSETNVYTIYFTYFGDHGWLGVAIWMLLLGIALTWLYRRASAGHLIAGLLFARLAASLVLSFQAEHFFNDLNYLIKFSLFLAALYFLIPWLLRGSREVHA